MKIRSQSGATLIVVLILLVIVTIVGTLAIRQSVTSLAIATNSQAQSLLMQTADSVFFSIESDNSVNSNLQQSISALGMFGIVKPNSYINKELVFCYRPKDRSNMFDIRDASTVYWSSSTSITNNELGITGFCQMQSNDYSSGRAAVITQVAVKKGSLNADTPFKFFPLGTDLATVQLQEVQPVRIVVTSVIPGAAASTTLPTGVSSFEQAVGNCFKNYTNDTVEAYPSNDTVADCFSNLGVPYNRQVMDYAIINYATKS
ncbi:PilX N-terminal domain-containing pilus assembly protein [Alkanindiges sp. WGS2144]|uniref:PilX N-terminal domain-containing pilus assembly protein n=1 Tax=Alkanindiges sp. WGS2144 TaxID=3366808 RepID=UPI00375296DF